MIIDATKQYVVSNQTAFKIIQRNLIIKNMKQTCCIVLKTYFRT